MPEQEGIMMNMPVIDMTATGKNIVRLRLAAGLSVRELQVLMGFSTPQAIYKWQHGAAMPNLDNLIALSAIFGVSMDEIIVTQNDAAVRFGA